MYLDVNLAFIWRMYGEEQLDGWSLEAEGIFMELGYICQWESPVFYRSKLEGL